ncbi:MAG: flippase-like domain-containing protein [Candidatus Aegiribacteria sp.]|nr:flippase-like domain-containing protein [Candidatus Aegiribacteria sp.]MBD3294540.1 flippase-like domain-containing protein [Candidatus Fermentibacteria bacterium]
MSVDKETPDPLLKGEEEILEEEVQGFDSARIKKGLYIFGVLTIAAFTGIFLYSHTGETIQALGHIQFKFFLLVLGLSIADMLIGALRNHIYFMVMSKHVTFWTSIRANLANIFMGAVTPSQSAGGPAQLYIYYNAGVSIGKAISVGVLNLLATIIFFVVSAGFSIYFLKDSFSPLMHSILFFCFVVFVIQLILYVLAVWKPEAALRIIQKISGKLASWMPRFEDKITSFTQKVVKELTAYKKTCSMFLGRHIYVPVLAVVLTFVLYVNKFILAYFIMIGLGASGDFVTVICIQALVLFISYYSISPGASGIAEVSIAALMSTVMSRNSIMMFTLLQRFFILYLPVILGAFVVGNEIRKTGSGNTES